MTQRINGFILGTAVPGVRHLASTLAGLAVKGVMSATSNEALVRRAIEAIWNRGDLDTADEFFTGDYVNHDGVIADLVVGPEGVKISAALHRLAFPHLRVVVEALTTDTDIVVLRWAAYGDSTPPSDGSAVQADRNTLSGATRCRLVNGKIAESWTEWNRNGVLRGLGLIPPN